LSKLLKNTTIITLAVLFINISGCTRRFEKIVRTYPLLRRSFLINQWCVVVTPFTATPTDVHGFTPREGTALAASFSHALTESGFAAEAGIDSVKLCKKRVLFMYCRVTKRYIEKKYARIVPHALLFCIPAILGWPTTTEICRIGLEVTVKVKGREHILGIFRAEYDYKEDMNIYKSSDESPISHPSLALGSVFSKLIESIEDALSKTSQPKEIIIKPQKKDNTHAKQRTHNIESTIPDSTQDDPDRPKVLRIPGARNTLTPEEPIPWDDIF